MWFRRARNSISAYSIVPKWHKVISSQYCDHVNALQGISLVLWPPEKSEGSSDRRRKFRPPSDGLTQTIGSIYPGKTEKPRSSRGFSRGFSESVWKAGFSFRLFGSNRPMAIGTSAGGRNFLPTFRAVIVQARFPAGVSEVWHSVAHGLWGVSQFWCYHRKPRGVEGESTIWREVKYWLRDSIRQGSIGGTRSILKWVFKKYWKKRMIWLRWYVQEEPSYKKYRQSHKSMCKCKRR